MSAWRKFGVVVAAALLPLALFTWGLLFSTYQMFAKPDQIKHSLETSGIYETFVSDVLDQAKQKESASEEKIPIDQADVKQVIEGAASPEYLKTQVEGFLDGVYGWVRGETDHLLWQVDLSGVKASLGDGLTKLAQDRVASLPTCSGQVDPQSFDALSADCIPRGVNTSAAVADIRNQIDKQFKDPVFTQDDLKNDQGKTLESQLSAVPNVYSKLMLGLWVGAILILLFAAAIIFLSVPLRMGLKRAGIIFVSVGAISIVIATLGAYAMKKAAENLGAEGEIRESALKVISSLADSFRNWWLIFAIIILVLGIGALVAAIVMKRKAGSTDSSDASSEQKIEPKPAQPTTEKSEKKQQSTKK